MRPREPSRAYAGRTVFLLTQHGKEGVVAPAFQERLQARVQVVGDVDTDTLGTFTRDVARFGTQLEAARRKATLALSGRGALGLGSEGSVVPGPFGFGSWDIELVLFLDIERDIEVVGRAYEPGLHAHGLVSSLIDLRDLADRAGFPEHGLVMRPDSQDDPRICKGLRSWDALEETFAHLRSISNTGSVFVENDLRAHQHPTRMRVIERATQDLVTRLSTPCPACSGPGFGVAGQRRGLPCEACGAPTEEPLADTLACVSCEHHEDRVLAGPAFADPARCSFCNP